MPAVADAAPIGSLNTKPLGDVVAANGLPAPEWTASPAPIFVPAELLAIPAVAGPSAPSNGEWPNGLAELMPCAPETKAAPVDVEIAVAVCEGAEGTPV